MHIDNYIVDKIGSNEERIYNKFTLQIYKAKELQLMLAENGFKTLGQYGIDGLEFKEYKTINILTLAQKATSFKSIDHAAITSRSY